MRVCDRVVFVARMRVIVILLPQSTVLASDRWPVQPHTAAVLAVGRDGHSSTYTAAAATSDASLQVAAYHSNTSGNTASLCQSAARQSTRLSMSSDNYVTRLTSHESQQTPQSATIIFTSFLVSRFQDHWHSRGSLSIVRTAVMLDWPLCIGNKLADVR